MGPLVPEQMQALENVRIAVKRSMTLVDAQNTQPKPSL